MKYLLSEEVPFFLFMILEESEVVDIDVFVDFGDSKEGLCGEEDAWFESLKVIFIIWFEEFINSNLLCFLFNFTISKFHT